MIDSDNGLPRSGPQAMRKAIPWSLTALFVLGIVSGVCRGQAPTPASLPHRPSKVFRVIDGDTVVLKLDGKPTTAPHRGRHPRDGPPNKPVERFGLEASDSSASWGRQVRQRRVRARGIPLAPCSFDAGLSPPRRPTKCRPVRQSRDHRPGLRVRLHEVPVSSHGPCPAAERVAREGRVVLWVAASSKCDRTQLVCPEFNDRLRQADRDASTTARGAGYLAKSRAPSPSIEPSRAIRRARCATPAAVGGGHLPECPLADLRRRPAPSSSR